MRIGQEINVVWEILGEKNVERDNRNIKPVCSGADSVFLWRSHRYPKKELSGIRVGFKDQKVFCKTFARALQVETK